MFGICNSLTLCDFTDQSFAVLCECNDGRSRSHTFGVGDNHRFTAFHNCYARVCRTKVNTDNLSHIISPFPDLTGRKLIFFKFLCFRIAAEIAYLFLFAIRSSLFPVSDFYACRAKKF